MLAGGARRGSRDSGGRPPVAAKGPAQACRSGARLPAPLALYRGSTSVGAGRWWLCAVLGAWRSALRSRHSPPPPAQAAFKSAPALAASSLINMQNHSVTH